MKRKKDSKIKNYSIYPLPLPNGVAILCQNQVSICWLQEGRLLGMVLQYQDLYITYQNIPILRGLAYLYSRTIGPLTELAKFKQKYHLQSMSTKKVGIDWSLWNKYIYSLILIVFYYYFTVKALDLFPTLFESHLIYFFSQMFTFIIIVTFIIIMLYLWVDWRRIRTFMGFYRAIHTLRSTEKYQLQSNSELGLFVYLLLSTLFINSFIVLPHPFLQIIFSFVSFFLVFSLLYELYYFFKKNLINYFCFFLYSPVLFIDKKLQKEMLPGQQQVAETTLRQLIKNIDLR